MFGQQMYNFYVQVTRGELAGLIEKGKRVSKRQKKQEEHHGEDPTEKTLAKRTASASKEPNGPTNSSKIKKKKTEYFKIR